MATTIESRSTGKGILLILATALIWGTTGTAQTLGPENIDPLVVGSLRIMIGALLITLRARLLNLRTDARWNPLLTGAGILFVVVFQLAFFSAVHQTGVVVATIIAIGTTPVFAGLFARIFLRERLLPMWFLAAALSILGVVLITGDIDATRVSPGGVLLALLAGVSYAAQTITIRRLVQDHHPELVMSRLFLGATLLVAPLPAVRPLDWLLSAHGVTTVLYLGIVATTIAYILFATGLRYVNGATAGVVSLAEPAAATLFGFFLLRESIPSRGVAGIVVIAAALVLVTLDASRQSLRGGRRRIRLPRFSLRQ